MIDTRSRSAKLSATRGWREVGLAVAVTCEHCGVRLRFQSEHQGRSAKCRACSQPVLVQGDIIPDHDVFLSYSTKDKQVADAVCAALEARRIRCWIAPRDVLAGKPWAGAILDAIGDARAMVLIYSSHANASPAVLREVDRAVSRGIAILPFRIERAAMSKEMEFYIAAAHWLDAMDGPMEQHIATLVTTVKRLLGPEPGAIPGASREPMRLPAPARHSVLAVISMCVSLVAVIGMAIIAWRMGRNARPDATHANAPAAIASPTIRSPSPGVAPVSPATAPSASASATPSAEPALPGVQTVTANTNSPPTAPPVDNAPPIASAATAPSSAAPAPSSPSPIVVTASLDPSQSSGAPTPQSGAGSNNQPGAQTRSDIRTPPPPAMPRINGPRIYGQRPRHPFLYAIPATGQQPIEFAASALPDGLVLDSHSGQISGSAARAGDYKVTLTARNSLGQDTRQILIRIGPHLALTPPMGWYSYGCFGTRVSQELIRAQASAMVSSGLSRHGWTYIDIDDNWQGRRGGSDRAIQSNSNFPDMHGLCDEIHAKGLKVGIYSAPEVHAYSGGPGETADNPAGDPAPRRPGRPPIGSYHFEPVDVRQWSQWGIDLMKYDFYPPINLQSVSTMSGVLSSAGRDMVYCISSNGNFSDAAEYARLANSWRTSRDVKDNWANVSGVGFNQARWAPFVGPGHWADPDALLVGVVGPDSPHQTGLTHDEQYTQMTLWCLLSAPLILASDLTRLDEFTLGLLSNDEVLAVDQDELGTPASPLSDTSSQKQIWAKKLADGSFAVGLFNRDAQAGDITLRLSMLRGKGPANVRDLWRQRDLGRIDDQITLPVAAHGAELLKVALGGAPK